MSIIEIAGLDEAMSPVPPGTYLAQVSEVSTGESSSGRPMITVSFAIADGPYAGRKLWDRFLQDHPVGIRRFGNLLRTLDYKPVGNAVDTSELVGRMVRLVVVHEEGENGELERIQRYAKP